MDSQSRASKDVIANTIGWLDSIIVPLYLSAVSAAVLVFSSALRAAKIRARWTLGPDQAVSSPLLANCQEPSLIPRSRFASLLLCGRAAVCISLFCQCAYTTVLSTRDGGNGIEWRHELSQCLFYLYLVALSICSLTRKISSMALDIHITTLLLSILVVYVYRDLWPLATYHLAPVDAALGWFIWLRIGLVAFAGLVVPLSLPHIHFPTDPQNPLPSSPEQTASNFSRLTFTHLDPLIFTASTHPHLPYEELPPLADVDHAAHLRKIAFPDLDPSIRKSQRHIFFAFLKIYANSWFVMTISILMYCLSGFVAPVALYQLLHYVETGGEGAHLKPWFWVGALLLRSVIGSLADHAYLYETSKFLVRTESIITQLVFEHALRIRMKEDVEPRPTVSTLPPTPRTPMNELPGGSTDDNSTINEADSTPSAATQIILTSQPHSAVTKPKGAPSSPTPSSRSSLIGRINSLISTDLDNIIEGRDLPYFIAFLPLKISLSTWFLYVILGWSTFVGVAFMIVGFFVPGKLAAMVHSVQTERMRKTDERVQDVTEILRLARLIKMFGWEKRTESRLRDRRKAELASIRKYLLYVLLNNNITFILPLLTLVVTFAAFTVIMKQPLNASIVSVGARRMRQEVFSSLGVLESLRQAMYRMLQLVPLLVTGKVSLDRVDDFLRNRELLDAHSSDDTNTTLQLMHAPNNGQRNREIGFRNAQFSWSVSPLAASEGGSGTATPTSASRTEFKLRVEGELFFEQKCLNLVIGPTAAGKTSLLLALLGELHFTPLPSAPNLGSWYNLPRGGGVSYCAQEPWILNQTIRENILFGQAFIEERYQQVLYQCALEQDLELFEAGDLTEVGERGLTLSGGQKARVSLARAVYSNAEIVLLDDVLAALDVHTVQWVVDKCLSGSLLRGRTVILVSHNLAAVGGLAKRVISFSAHGVASVIALTAEVITRAAPVTQQTSRVDADKPYDMIDEPNVPIVGKARASGKLIAEEEIAFGHVSFSAIILYFKSMGGFVFMLVYLITDGLTNSVDLFQTWWLGFWARAYESVPTDRVNAVYYLGIYCLTILASEASYSISQILWIGGGIRAAKALHKRLATAILNTTIRFLDKTPVGRITQRFTKDIGSVDASLPRKVQSTIDLTMSVVQRLVIIVLFAPVFITPGIMLAVMGTIIGQLYIKAQLPVKREMSNSRAPVFSHFSSAINGLTTIRAYGAQDKFKDESIARIDKYTRAARPYWNLNRWLGIRIDFLGGLFSAGLAAHLVYFSKSSASNIGFLLNTSLWATELLLYWIRYVNAVEVEGNSLERIQQYVEIEQEQPPTESGKPPAHWPASGNLSVEGLSARYSLDGPEVLHGVTFSCQSGEKIGVVGRTGSGKSSLTLSLLRLIPTTGEVYFDGIPTSALNLESLRGNITIIPQQPELMSGTIRENLDPFAEHDDLELNDALQAAGLFSLQEDLNEEERITLDTSVSSAGSNFSLGQRQIIALARALVRRSRVLILDEATASMDHKTDALIQKSLRTQFNDCTVLTVAHRLHTIMDADKIIVLDAGNLTEFDSPVNLLTKDSGAFKSMVDSTGDRDALYDMAMASARPKYSS